MEVSVVPCTTYGGRKYQFNVPAEWSLGGDILLSGLWISAEKELLNGFEFYYRNLGMSMYFRIDEDTNLLSKFDVPVIIREDLPFYFNEMFVQTKRHLEDLTVTFQWRYLENDLDEPRMIYKLRTGQCETAFGTPGLLTSDTMYLQVVNGQDEPCEFDPGDVPVWGTMISPYTVRLDGPSWETFSMDEPSRIFKYIFVSTIR